MYYRRRIIIVMKKKMRGMSSVSPRGTRGVSLAKLLQKIAEFCLGPNLPSPRSWLPCCARGTMRGALQGMLEREWRGRERVGDGRHGAAVLHPPIRQSRRPLPRPVPSAKQSQKQWALPHRPSRNRSRRADWSAFETEEGCRGESPRGSTGPRVVPSFRCVRFGAHNCTPTRVRVDAIIFFSKNNN